MKLKDQLSLIIGLLAIKLLILLGDTFIPAESIYINDVLFVFHKISDLLIILYLYKFIKMDKKQEIAIVPVAMIAVAILYFVALRFVFIQFAPGITDQLWSSVLPSFIRLIGELILAIQLIKNKSEDGSRDSIKFVGISFLFTMGLMVIYPIVTMTENLWLMSIVRMMTMLPLIVMLYMYWQELKRVNTFIEN